MPRDKRFDKRGGGKRLDAISAEEIELRNAQLEEFEETREQRRRVEEEDDDKAVRVVAERAKGAPPSQWIWKEISSRRTESSGQIPRP